MKAHSSLLVIGRNGFLGSTLVSQLDADAVDRRQLNLAKVKSSSIDQLLERRYRHIAVSAAVTDVEYCYKNLFESRQINVLGTIELLEKVRQTESVPIFFSSDYVFSPNEKPRREDDEKNPETVYGKQKLEVEDYIVKNFEKFLIFRTSKLMSKKFHTKNILSPIVDSLKNNRPIRLFEDQWLNPVFTEDIALVVKRAMETDLRGIFHLGTRQVFSRAGLGRCMARHLGFDIQLIHSSSMRDIVTSEPRPNHNTLNCEKLEKALGFQFTEVVEGLSDFQELLK
jgi:dTDP-4-dehydrorhamnose reductase